MPHGLGINRLDSEHGGRTEHFSRKPRVSKTTRHKLHVEIAKH